ncbi:hypothetical protein HanHA300_Chr09g0300781 [Helianthus annuus]|nr:hypothetical protein HanHA300_Chr09g0300781 [Helianthus annuus]KAJ0540670.1 hypothetical protein HanHA89_Chr09g0319451 [Helianthus annuus]KAJ0705817.1 hypothetical protein HanLR1_Chr09g0299691 [Helianthus annuus]KAJ0709950.1 hypothetical protein HanOQP8_Chr09g0306481 [Helianthus annuus]
MIRQPFERCKSCETAVFNDFVCLSWTCCLGFCLRTRIFDML